ncbi:MAG: hypothetical protein JO172_13000 [Hyphomicrobiales bacterium]|nr:hypothetical protein [Hyphomicrobiales bacterium]
MRHFLSRRRFIAGITVLCCARTASAFSASPKAVDFDDPFLGQTSQGDLILAPQKTHAAAMIPTQPEFFGIVRKTNVLPNDQDKAKVNLLALYAGFRDAECRVSLCNLSTLAHSTALPVRQAYEALTTIALRLRERPDSVYAIQDADELTRVSCAKSGSRSVIVWKEPKASVVIEG